MVRIALLTIGFVFAAFTSASTPASAVETLTPEQQAFEKIYRELVETNTVTREGFGGSTLLAAQKLQKHFLAAGFKSEDVRVYQVTDAAGKPVPNKGCIVAKLRGSGTGPSILVAGHIDTVPAQVEEVEIDEIANGKPTGKKITRKNWDTDPFKLTIVAGQFGPEYRGRGVIDDKAMVASLAANLIRLKKEGFQPKGDIIFAGTTDEELGNEGVNGMEWILTNKESRGFIGTPDYVINEGGAGLLTEDGKFKSMDVETAQKTYMDVTVKAQGAALHGSRAAPQDADGSAILKVAKAMDVMSHVQFPIELNDTTRNYFSELAKVQPDLRKEITYLLDDSQDKGAKKFIKLATILKDRDLNKLLRTTAAVTMMKAGEAPNAVPDTAQGNVNVRIMPGTGDTSVAVLKRLREALDKAELSDVAIAPAADVTSSPASPLDPVILGAVRDSVKIVWPKESFPVIPGMIAGGTDNRYARLAGIKAYGLNGMFLDKDEGAMHSPNEHGRVKDVLDGYAFFYNFLKIIGSQEKNA